MQKFSSFSLLLFSFVVTLTNSGTAAVLIGSLLVAYQKYFIKKNVKSPLKQGIL